jgi:hypothetical protein
MKKLHSPHASSKGAALIIVLALVVIAAAVVLTYFSRTTTDRHLAQTSHNDTSADLLARSALDITVSDFKQEIATNQPVNTNNIKPVRYPAGIPDNNPNLIRYSSRNAAASRASTVRSTDASANGRSISLARWNSHYLIPPASATGIDSSPIGSFVPPDWVLVTPQGPVSAPAPNAVIGRYAFAVYDEGGLMTMNVGGFPTYASLSLPALPTLPGRPAPPARRMAPKYPVEESEIMLVVNPNPPDPCNGQNRVPKFTPDHTNATVNTGQPVSIIFNTSGAMPQTFSVSALPHGLSINPSNGNITGIPTSLGPFDATVTATNACGSGTAALHFNIDGFPSPDTTPWPVNLARKGTIAFADLKTLPSTPTAITPTTTVGQMGNFLASNQIDKIMGWRNFATTQQTGASFNSPSFLLASADNYARYFLGNEPPYLTPYTTVSTASSGNRTDQAFMTRQELIRLQRTLDNPSGQFPQSLLQYLGTFSREHNQPAPDWPQLSGKMSARWDMNNMQLMIPDSWLAPGHHGQGHAYGKQRHSDIGILFGLMWVDGNFIPGTRTTDPNYYGHWKYIGKLKQSNNPPLQGDTVDFFSIIDYAMNQAVGLPPNSPDHMRNTFNVGAALIDMYDTDDLIDPDPNPPSNSDFGNPITIIDYGGASYAYGIEGMSFEDPNVNTLRPYFAPYPAPVPNNYVLLNRRFENVGEFGYAYSPASTVPSKTLDFASSNSNDRALMDFFTYNAAGVREGIVNLNTRNGPVLASIIRGALLHDFGYEIQPTSLVSQDVALAAGQAIVQETTSATPGRGPVLNRGDVGRLAAAAAPQLPVIPGVPVDEVNQTIARALAEMGQARTWNLMIDVIAQTGNYAPGTPDLTDPSKFIVQGEKRYWLHVALDRDDGTVLGTQLEELVE